MTPPSSRDVDRFRELLAECIGWQFDESKHDSLARILVGRASALGLDSGRYLDQLRAGTAPAGEIGALARELTITETYFMRYSDQFSAFVHRALVERLAAAADNEVLRILSMGCASGEEPYSLAIVIREQLPEAADRVAITAADINPAMLEKARRAHYSSWALREVQPAMLERWFTPVGHEYSLRPEITRAVRFEHRNLAVDDAGVWMPAHYDIVFCRNLIMYFTPEQARAAVARISQAMKPGAYLFLGHAETLRGLSNDFHVCHSDDAFYYQRCEGATEPLHSPLDSTQPRWRLEPAIDGSWVETIRLAAERIETLSNRRDDLAQGVAVPAQATPDLSPVHDFLQRERYGQALAHLDTLATGHRADPDVLLLRAVVLSHSGAVAEAEAACRVLLAEDEFSAGAHYVLALCHESRGDLAGAREQDQIASYLDPNFAMPRLHLGLLARRMRDLDSAARELERAALLLQREDASRLLLFGGGFQREALIALCQTADARTGGY